MPADLKGISMVPDPRVAIGREGPEWRCVVRCAVLLSLWNCYGSDSPCGLQFATHNE